MRTDAFDYHLPPERIAQHPIEPRDSARLMLLQRRSEQIRHAVFRDLPSLLAPGDLLVANDSRVMPARIRGRKLDGGGRVEALLLRPEASPLEWRCLVRGRLRVGSRLRFGGETDGAVEARVLELMPSGERRLRFDRAPDGWLGALGEVPLPPYIHAQLDDPERYQTIYARVAGSAAAPTAGLHFTPELVETLTRRGLGWASVTLHIGLDTFRPVESETVEDHRIHREWLEVPEPTAAAVAKTRAEGGRVIAVGTTSVRALETAARWALAAEDPAPVRAGAGWSELFLRPGSRIHAVDGLITNFHLPRSSLLMLVAAFADKALVDRAYREAIAEHYRFYSFGDAMLIL